MQTRVRPVNPAVRAEPRGIGTAGARDPLAREVKLLGALLGQVIVEQAGPELLELVERVRHATIALRHTGRAEYRRALEAELDGIELADAEVLIRAFSLYFQLANLAEEKQRVRRNRTRSRTAPKGALNESLAEAVDHLVASGLGIEAVRRLAGDLCISLVLTAHPTEARRRTTLVALRRCYRLLDQLDDPRLTPGEDAEIRRRLREEISLLWHTSALRIHAPTPLDEVRSVMAFFDESLFVVTPRLYRALDAALDRDGEARPDPGAASAARDSGRTGTRAPFAGPFLGWGSWIGGDRDGNPFVTADTTRQALRIQADHVLRGYEAVTTRLAQAIAATVASPAVVPRLAERLEADALQLPEAARVLTRRFPEEPYRQRLGFIAERLRRTRGRLVGSGGASGSGARGAVGGPPPTAGAYDRPAALLAELDELRNALVADRLGRVAHGELGDLRWQVETFGFHALSLEVRQHSSVHAAALAVLRGPDGHRPGALDFEAAPRVTVGEVLHTFRAMAEIQEAFGVEACSRYIVSFTHSERDVYDVLELAERAMGGTLDGGLVEGPSPAPGPVLDVVPLFELADALEGAERIVDRLLADPGYRRHLDSRDCAQEVMLGYSDSTKELGALAAAWMLYRAQGRLAAVARRHGIRLTLFHGRGGAIGRGGGPMNRAILAQAPGSIDGRLKLTEQGEVIADRYANPQIAQRHLEQVANAVLVTSPLDHDERARRAEESGADALDELASISRHAYRSLVWEDPSFEDYFRAATPIEELAGLAIGSRPAARASGGGGGADAGGASGGRDRPPVARGGSLESLRAIPWVFAWSQSRANLPGWYGIGTALERFELEHGEVGLARLRELYAAWPFFASVLDTAEMSLAKADMQVAGRYAELATGPEMRRIWRTIRDEFERTSAAILRVTGRGRLLDAMPVLQRSIELRNPYVDSLSELQVRLLARLRALPAGSPEREALLRLVLLTVSGVAAGVQNTG